MSSQRKKTTLEVKVRPYGTPAKERQDQKGVARVYMSADALHELGIKPGQTCFLSKPHIGEGEGEGETKREAVAWNAAETTMKKGVVQMSRALQEACGFKIGADLVIQGGGDVKKASLVTTIDVTAEEGKAEELGEERVHWAWLLDHHLARAESIFPGMVFEVYLSPPGIKRTFRLHQVNDSFFGLASYDQTSSVQIISHQPAETGTPGKLKAVDIAGIDLALRQLNNFLDNFSRRFKIPWAQRSCGVLIHGDRGMGKTLLMNQVASTGWGEVYRIEWDATASEMTDIFTVARLKQPSIVVIDDLESLFATTPNMDRVLCHEMDSLLLGCPPHVLPRVVVMAATSEISKINPNLRKLGRFPTSIMLSVPDLVARKAILKSLDPPIGPSVRDETLDKLGQRTHAFTPNDLVELLHEACFIAEQRYDDADPEPESDCYVSPEDIDKAFLDFRPTVMHDVTLQIPYVKWEDIGGQDSLKDQLRSAIEAPLKYPDRMRRLGAQPTKGILLYGPPGCSKTLTAQAIATESGFNFLAVKGAELLNMYVGESERSLRDIFTRARAAAPSIIFFDEIESIASKRDSGGRGGNGVNMLTTLLNEMDGIEPLKGVMILAATNQPQALDLALLRPGRFDRLYYVPPPDLAGRAAIFKLRTSKVDCADDVDVAELARRTEGCSGADVVGICEVAGHIVLEKIIDSESQDLKIQMGDFEAAIKKVKKRITLEMEQAYEQWAEGVKGA